MILIKEAEEYAKLQRTSATIDQIKQSYQDDARMIMQEMGCELKDHTSRMLDIGCGIAGPESFFTVVDLYLIDKTTIDQDLHYGFQKTGSFYNSLDIAKKNLMANGVPEENIHLQEATPDNKILFDVEFDLVISLISCGFHYPVDTYLKQIYEKLLPGGVLIIDIRKGTDGKEKIQKKFGNLRVIQDQKKYERVLAVKQ